ncbi:hypothetical protein GCM10017772_23560 [Promicromonospora soli]|uniref:Uncharacterized protein n=1 Tax=Promicromonospora soli TaxID=2035533 RepID=A0A919KVB6_9MICO|nr:hypothetical protein GCM10017772_23560 [Promicromonospora soli]
MNAFSSKSASAPWGAKMVITSSGEVSGPDEQAESAPAETANAAPAAAARANLLVIFDCLSLTS